MKEKQYRAWGSIPGNAARHGDACPWAMPDMSYTMRTRVKPATARVEESDEKDSVALVTTDREIKEGAPGFPLAATHEKRQIDHWSQFHQRKRR